MNLKNAALSGLFRSEQRQNHRLRIVNDAISFAENDDKKTPLGYELDINATEAGL